MAVTETGDSVEVSRAAGPELALRRKGVLCSRRLSQRRDRVGTQASQSRSNERKRRVRPVCKDF